MDSLLLAGSATHEFRASWRATGSPEVPTEARDAHARVRSRSLGLVLACLFRLRTCTHVHSYCGCLLQVPCQMLVMHVNSYQQGA